MTNFIHRISVNKIVALSLFCGTAMLSTQANAALCSYKIDQEWNTGYTATITITNNSSNAVSNWAVNWKFAKNKITSSWNAQLVGTNPYTASPVSWNSTIQANQSVNFGFQADKNAGVAETPVLGGATCSNAASSSVAKSSVSSSKAASISSSSSTSSKASSKTSSISSSGTTSSKASSSASSKSSVATSVSSSSSEQASSSSALSVPAGNPGLRNTDGSAHNIVSPTAAPNIINVVTRAAELGYSIDTKDSATNDQPAILAVLNDSSTTSGSTLYFPNGTYNISSLTLNKNGVHLVGESRALTLIKSSLNGSGAVLTISGKNNIAVKNMTFTSTWKGTYSTSTSVTNPSAGGPDYMVATGSNAHSITIDNIIVEKYSRMGVRLGAGSHDVVVKNSLAKNATDVAGGGAGYGFVIQGDGPVTGATSNPFLGDKTKDSYFNVLENNVTEGPYIRHAVIVQYWTHNNLIRNNLFDKTQLDAIDLHGEDEYANEVSQNTVSNSKRAGIALGNTGASHDKTGDYNWIHSNTLIGCAWGITVQYGTDYSTIENNIIRDNATNSADPKCAICLGKSSYSLLRNNSVSNYTATGYAGVMLIDDPKVNTESAGGPTHWMIEGNRVTNTGVPFKDQATMDGANIIQTKW
jgi:Cellulose binding domain/Pectate lyase superfamily protein